MCIILNIRTACFARRKRQTKEIGSRFNYRYTYSAGSTNKKV